jgi:TP901 family phage tail tape measure protein
MVNKFGRGLKRGARTAAASLALISVAAANIGAAGADFQQAITDVGAVGLQTRAQIAPLEQQALQLGRTTKFTATQAANAMEVLARAGFNTQQILEATPAVLSAAAASGLEIAEVAGHVSNVLKGMGLEMDQAARVADVLALASARTNSSIGSLGESMKNAAATSRKLGVPLEDVIASVALLQDVGLDASVAGSAFNVMLTKMATPSAKIEKIMRRLKISFKDVDGNMKPLPTVIKDINKASKAMGGNFDQVAFLAELVGLRGQKAASNLADLFDTGKLEKLTDELRNATGAADQMANLRMDTVRGSVLLLGSAVDAVKVKIFGLNEGPLKDIIDKMTTWVSANEDLIASKIGKFINDLIINLPTIVEWFKRIAIGMAIFVSLSVILKTLIGVLTLVNLVMAANPIVLIILGFIALIAAIAAAVIWWDELTEAFLNAGKATDFIIAGIALLTGPIGWLIGAAALIFKHWDPIKAFFSDLWDGVVNIFNTAVADIIEKVDQIKGAATGIVNTISNLGSGAAGFLGFGDGTEKQRDQAGPQIIGSNERVARAITERTETNRSEILIKDETGRAEAAGSFLGPGISLQSTGAF